MARCLLGGRCGCLGYHKGWSRIAARTGAYGLGASRFFIVAIVAVSMAALEEVIMGEASQQQPECRNVETLVQAGDTFQDFVDTIWRLRQPDGCPWDRKQTHASIAKNMIEEAYEAVDCIEANDPAHLCEELGDVLMQVVLHAQIACDAEEFSIDDVVRGVNEKLIRRHPHVFGEADASNSDEVLALWDSIKLKEKAARDASAEREDERPEGLLDGVPTSLPALMQAQKVSKKAAAVGFEWENVEERAEFEAEEPGTDARAMEFGDLLFALVNVARKEGIDAESALRASTMKFRHRWGLMEDVAFDEGVSLEDLSVKELNDMWDSAKATAGDAE